MAERSSISQVVQIGVETTPGTAVAAGKRLQSVGIEPTPNQEVAQFRPTGQKYRALTVLGKEWSTLNLSGVPTYDEIIYPLSSVLTTPVHTTLAGDGEQWVFSPETTDEDTPKTFTVEQGSSIRAHRFPGAIFGDMGLTISRGEVSISGSGMAHAIEDDITLTASPTVLPLVPVVPSTFDVFIDPLYADIGDTKMTRLLQANWSLGNRFGPLWTVNSDLDSYAATVETEPTLEIQFTMAADEQGMDLLTDLRTGGQMHMRLQATGGTVDIPAATDNYSFTLDMSLALTGQALQDQEGVYAVQWSGVGTHSEDLGGALEVTVVNGTAAL